MKVTDKITITNLLINIKRIFIRMWLNYKIRRLCKSIKNVELNIYFDRWIGKECIEYIEYCYDKINELKLKLKNYE